MYRDSNRISDYASPPCFAHELEAGCAGASLRERSAAEDVRRWRRAERERLISARLSLANAERERLAREIIGEIEQWVEPGPGLKIGLYWPWRAEPDLRGCFEPWHRNGARVALPVVRARNEPLVFRQWTPSCRLRPGAMKIPVPVEGDEIVPNVVVAPLVGFDARGYRLGYGGGYFDRTLASLAPQPFTIGVGYPSQQIATIYPQAHDVPMDIVIHGRNEVIERPGLWPIRSDRVRRRHGVG